MELKINTNKNKEVIDITDTISKIISDNGWRGGAVLIFSKHTTCAITTADLDPGTDEDTLDAVEKMIPQGKYRHPHNPAHVGDHIMSSIIGPSVIIPVDQGELVLGTWQKIVLIELSGPRERLLEIRYLRTS